MVVHLNKDVLVTRVRSPSPEVEGAIFDPEHLCGILEPIVVRVLRIEDAVTVAAVEVAGADRGFEQLAEPIGVPIGDPKVIRVQIDNTAWRRILVGPWTVGGFVSIGSEVGPPAQNVY